jgi:GGDEF domain-containing protein
MLNRVAETTVIQGHNLAVSASLGYTLYPFDSANAEILLHHADQAMYEAKSRGKNCFHLYELIDS